MLKWKSKGFTTTKMNKNFVFDGYIMVDLIIILESPQ